MGMATGRNPYRLSKNLLTSSQLSSGERKLDGAFVAAGVLVMFVCARTDGPQSASSMKIPRIHNPENSEGRPGNCVELMDYSSNAAETLSTSSGQSTQIQITRL